MSTYRVSIFDLLHSAKDGGAPVIVDPNRILKIVIAVVFLANICCAVVLLVSIQLGGNFSWDAFLNAAILIPHWDDITTYFTEGTNDCLWIALIQIVVFPLIAYGAIRSGSGTEENTAARDRPGSCGCFRCFYQLGKKMKNKMGKYVGKDERKKAARKYERLKRRSDREEPLLDMNESDQEGVHEIVEKDNDEDKNDDEQEDKHDHAIKSSGGGVLSGFEAEDRAMKADTRKSDESYLSARSIAMTHRGYWLTFLYFVSTAMQCYLGLKCISFQFADESRQGALMAMGVVAITIVVWALKEVIVADTKVSLVSSCIFAHSHSLTHFLTHSFTHPLTHSITHPITHFLTHSLTHSLTPSCFTSGDGRTCPANPPASFASRSYPRWTLLRPMRSTDHR